MTAAAIPTANYSVARSRSECRRLASEMLGDTGGAVLKASGLAGGKGVFVCRSMADIEAGLARLYGTMTTAAEQVVVEQILIGRECSFFVLLGGGIKSSLGFAVDFKRLKDGDLGPNTGGMGCYTPVEWLPSDAEQIVHTQIVEPLVNELKKRQMSYTGFLYVGLMWTEHGPEVVEFNVRLGDPEAQILAVCDQSDWGELVLRHVGLPPAKAESTLASQAERAAVGVVMASAGYPYGEGEQSSSKLPGELIAEDDHSVVFTASISSNEAGAFWNGNGRVLTVVGYGTDLADARQHAYARVERLKQVWPSAQVRSDIAQRVVTEFP